jgi:hypothetical protein
MTATHENYPCWIVIVSNLLSLAIYVSGAFILYQFGIFWAAVYLLFIVFQNLMLLKNHCVDCYYYGKTCAFGKGRLSSLLFKKGDPSRFAKMTITKKDIIPDFLVFIAPAIAGIWILITGFNWIILTAVIVLFVAGFFGNAVVRGSLACKYCKQREAGCPAQKLFEKKK